MSHSHVRMDAPGIHTYGHSHMHSHSEDRKNQLEEYNEDGRPKSKKKKKKKKKGRSRYHKSERDSSSGEKRIAIDTGRKKGKRKIKNLLPMFDRRRGMPRHCMCFELCLGWNGHGPRHNIQHLPLFQYMDKKQYRPGQRRRNSRFRYCYRNVGNWITGFFSFVGLVSAILALWLYLKPCTPIIEDYEVLENVTVYSDEKVQHTNYKYDAANVLIMLDFSGSITESMWIEEVEAAETVIDIFQKNLAASVPFRAGAIRWGDDPSFLTARAGPAGSGLGPITTVLGQDIGGLRRALEESKLQTPGQNTLFLQPFAWYEREMDLRSTRTIMSKKSGIVHHEFAVFITDGAAIDYTPYVNNNGHDQPFSGSYSSIYSGYDQAVKMFCNKRGWCSGAGSECADGHAIDPVTGREKTWPCPCVSYSPSRPLTGPPGSGSETCSTANVIRRVKDRPNTKVLGIFVGRSNDNGNIALHNLSSCDSYTMDPKTHDSQCPFFASVEDFSALQKQLINLIGTLTAEVSTTSEVVTTSQKVPQILTKRNVTLVEVCEKDANILLMLLLFLPLLVWCMALPTYILTKAICCPDYIVQESSDDENESFQLCLHGMTCEDCPECCTCPHGIRTTDCSYCQECSHGRCRGECQDCNTEIVTETHVHVVQDTLPAPWVMYLDKDSGQPYYYNTLTGETRWVKPGESAADFAGPKLSRVEQLEDNATYKWSASTGRRINMTDEDRLVHAQGARRLDAMEWRKRFKKQLDTEGSLAQVTGRSSEVMSL